MTEKNFCRIVGSKDPWMLEAALGRNEQSLRRRKRRNMGQPSLELQRSLGHPPAWWQLYCRLQIRATKR